MMYVDRRAGSGELFLPLQSAGLACELTTLDYGDCAFVGNGSAGEILIGIERKTVRDLLQSMQTGRLSGHQLPGLVEQYAYRWLLVEGPYRCGKDGRIEIPWRTGWEPVRLMYSAVEAYLLTLTLRGGLHVQRTFGIQESAQWLAALYHWWTAKDWQAHRSHLALHQPADAAIWSRPTLVQRMAAQLPGIDEKAKPVGEHFKTVAAMVAAEETQWRTIPGIGKVTAARVRAAMRDPSA